MSEIATPNKDLLKKLILQRGGNNRLWTALAALCIGTALLLIAVLIWWNFRELLHGRGSNDSLGSTFLTISKRVTNENMGTKGATSFSNEDIAALGKVAEVEDVGTVKSVKPEVYMKMEISPGLGFSTIMILEAVPDRFMDKLPADWKWAPGEVEVPIILSSSFLSLYNYVFAPSQGLPQLSEESIQALPFKMEVNNGIEKTLYIARVAGFSDRITSVLAPASFADAVNATMPGGSTDAPSRLVVKLKDPSSTVFGNYLKDKDYITNAEQLRWNRLRAIVQVIASATGILALLLMGVSVLVFILFIELTVARAQDAVRLLLQLGYSPKGIGSFMYRHFMPMILGAIGIALLLACAAQIGAAVMGKGEQLQLGYLPGWPTWVVAALSLGVLTFQMRRGVTKALGRV